ncbi:MAG TPA: hypothetical protein DCE55_24070 [Planctomycetaceae bacterium]|nr:hypothetical protein [Planctomycetaceae bacterium]|tara:strand:+ start:21944 stop:22336 length:393 start_codon:yes stop_codon:yes gene_type:complete
MGAQSEGFKPSDTTPPPSTKASTSAQSNTEDILDQVVHETLKHVNVEQLAPDTLQDLVFVARQFGKVPLTLDPIGIALIDALLKPWKQDRDLPTDFWHDMARDIATLILEAPDNQQKLSQFWTQLTALAR